MEQNNNPETKGNNPETNNVQNEFEERRVDQLVSKATAPKLLPDLYEAIGHKEEKTADANIVQSALDNITKNFTR